MDYLKHSSISLLILILCSFSANADEINIAIIDTGIDPHNSAFKNRLYIGKNKATSDHYGVDFSKSAFDKKSPYDEHGHGTHIAGIIAELAPKAKLHILKYYNPQASGEENLQSTIDALEYAINIGVDIINYSSGGPEPSINEERLFNLAEKKGIIIVSAAGNEGENIDIQGREFFPASYRNKNIITVGAHNDKYEPLKSSNYGHTSVDIFAPGKRILSTLPNNRRGYLSGTSQATAFVSARVSNLMQKLNSKNSAKIKKYLFSNSLKQKNIKGLCLSNGALNPVNVMTPLAFGN